MSEDSARRSTPAGDGTLVTPSRLRAAVARQMAASKREIPHFYVSTEIAMDGALAELRELTSGSGPGARITVSALLIHRLARTLREHRAFNALATKDGFVIVDSVNVGVAIALEDGLIAPALLDADRMDVRELAGALEDLVARSRAGRLRTAELTGATFTLSNLGMYCVRGYRAAAAGRDPSRRAQHSTAGGRGRRGCSPTGDDGYAGGRSPDRRRGAGRALPRDVPGAHRGHARGRVGRSAQHAAAEAIATYGRRRVEELRVAVDASVGFWVGTSVGGTFVGGTAVGGTAVGGVAA